MSIAYLMNASFIKSSKPMAINFVDVLVSISMVELIMIRLARSGEC